MNNDQRDRLPPLTKEQSIKGWLWMAGLSIAAVVLASAFSAWYTPFEGNGVKSDLPPEHERRAAYERVRRAAAADRPSGKTLHSAPTGEECYVYGNVPMELRDDLCQIASAIQATDNRLIVQMRRSFAMLARARHLDSESMMQRISRAYAATSGNANGWVEFHYDGIPLARASAGFTGQVKVRYE